MAIFERSLRNIEELKKMKAEKTAKSIQIKLSIFKKQ